MNGLIIVLVAAAAALLVWALTSTVKESLATFEEKYAAAGKANLDALYITLEPRQLMMLSISSASLICFLVTIIANVAIGLVAGLLGLFVPLFTLNYLKKKRQKLFNEQLVDALGNMGNSLKAGFTLPQSIELIGREMDDPIGMEFRIAHSEMRLGLPPVEALQNMCDRMRINDLDLVVTAFGISEGVGGNLTRIFETIASTIRERFRVEGRIQSLSAMGRMQGYVLIAMPFAITGFMVKFQPEFIEPLFESTLGHIALAGSLIWLGLGWLSIKKIVDIDV